MTATGPYLVRSDWDARIWIEGVGEAERRLEVTPGIAGWRHLSFRTYTFRVGQVIDGESAGDEMAMVLLSGDVTIAIAGPGGTHEWRCAGRADLFAGPPHVLYLPPGHTYKTTVHADADCAYGRAPATGARVPRLLMPADATATTDVEGNRIHHLLDTGVTEHLLCRETVLEPGGWAWLPPHRHDGLDGSPALDEVTYYRTDPADGWGMQLVTGADGADVPLVVRLGDAVVVRGGSHPAVAAPGTRLYALTFMAGPAPEWPA